MDTIERPAWSRASSRREFLRTYKACISCRQRKAKCELGGSNDRGIPPGPPCQRCRREQRNCQFSEDRAWARKKKKGMRAIIPHLTTRILVFGEGKVDSGNTSAPEPTTPFTSSSQIPGDGDTTEEINNNSGTMSRNNSVHDGFYSSTTNGDIDTPSSTTGHNFPSVLPTPAGAQGGISGHASSVHYDHAGRASADLSVGSGSPILTSSTASRRRPELQVNTSERQHHPQPQHQPTSNDSSGLQDSVMRTVVSSGNDALNILFQAAAQEQNNDMGDIGSNAGGQSRGQDGQSGGGPDTATTSRDGVGANLVPGGGALDRHSDQTYLHQRQKGHPTGQGQGHQYGTPGSSTSFATAPTLSEPVQLSEVEQDVLAVWNSCRMDNIRFYQNMARLSPILSDFYSYHRNHYWLISQEPVLCCTILMISSRYHTLPGVGGSSRGFFIHQRLWHHCQHLIMRVMLGQEKGSKAKTRTVGTIEALLLMSEWHPRSLHFPPDSDGWDSDLMMSDNNLSGHDPAATTPDPSGSASNRWLEDVIEPARRSDRMSWMLLGSGLTLAHELGIFDTDDSRAKSLIASPDLEENTQRHDEAVNLRRLRIRQLLYVFINQLASRLGCMSLMPKNLNHSVIAPLASPNSPYQNDEWQTFMNSWIELTKLAKSVTDMFFPSVSFTRQQLHSGRYIGLLDHFRPLLSQWRQKHLDCRHFSPPFHDMIFIEYQFVRVYTNSIGMQAVVERVLAEADNDTVMDDVRQNNMDEIDYEFIQEVIDGSCHILQKVISLAETGALRFSPVRIFLRITSSSIFLLKALSLGVRNAKLQECLDILTRSIQALRSSSLDDIHLASRYATLLESLLSRLRRSFVLSNKNLKVSRGTTRPSSVRPLSRTQNGSLGYQNPQQQHQQQQQQQLHQLHSQTAQLTPQQQQQQQQQAHMQQFSPQNDMPGPIPMNPPMDIKYAPPVFEEAITSLNDISADDWLSLPFDPSMAPFGDGGNQAWSGFEGSNLNFIWNLPT
ncbi:hypothetical protein FQN57_004705 [Myotisia sp. PD_48]|nr:hypothetical protein FQN57_004705 [Myotisia sp. PD_48]